MEAEKGEPLVGPTGGWLRGRYDEGRHAWFGGLLGRAGIRDSDCSRMNVIQCRPPNNKFPTDPEARSYITPQEAQLAVSHCIKEHVNPVLRGRAWRRIDLLGDKALRFLAGKTEGITVWRGSPLALVETPDVINAVPTLHPAALARDQAIIPAVVSDLKKSLVLPPENYRTHPSLQDVQAFQADSFAFDIETIPETGQITMVGLASKRFEAICVPFGGAYITELKRIFSNAREVVGHNCIQFDLPHLREHSVNVNVDTTVWDTMLMQHLLQPDLPHSLAFVGSIFTNKPAWKHLSGEDEELYCCRDVDVTWQCYEQLRPLLRSENLMDLYQQVQVPLARICRLMHETGIAIDPGRIGVVREKLLEEMKQDEADLPVLLRTYQKAITKRVEAPVGTVSEKTGKPLKYIRVPATEEVVPWRSPTIVARYLYEELGLPPQVHPKTQQVSTGKVALDWLYRRASRGDLRAVDKRPLPPGLPRIIGALRSLRIKDELITTFCQEKMLHVQRLHPHFNVHGTATGRLSSSDPNLQNIPLSARYVYVPSQADWRFLEVDFSGLENRLTAWFARDKERLGRLSDPSFNEHKANAAVFFGIRYEDVEKSGDREAPYFKAKTVNHGCDGGMGPKKISAMYDMDFREVRDMVAKWRQINAVTVQWQERIAAQAKADGQLTNPFGRKRWFYTDSYYTESVRTPAQGTGADVCFRGMLGLLWDRIGLSEEEISRIVKVYCPLPAHVRCIIQVHDSLLFEGPAQEIDEAIFVIKHVLEQPWPELDGYSIPVEFKLGAPGASWGELEKI